MHKRMQPGYHLLCPVLVGGRKLDEGKGEFGVCSNSLGKSSKFTHGLGQRDVA